MTDITSAHKRSDAHRPVRRRYVLACGTRHTDRLRRLTNLRLFFCCSPGLFNGLFCHPA
jgi:hypothetical protein